MDIKPKTKNIKLLIFENGHSLRSFSIANNLSAPYLSDVLNLKVIPSGKYAKKIADGLNVEISEIFEVEKKEEV
ncbi:helix-turn-helix transcriptional regulator [Staphylococcus haemolyticus]|uniref:helix-turn-helix transcriptional regulator n=1 Tax=Staphylococcus haemolyticus TaxID=1283 RepID=UPI0028A367FB|nr:helix-turn-helix transcriptional regulator [Staphylococcus haemolyticus]MDT3949751.1 helix-turn-helix transcriptional regulator [Staphylococcus haemolyticus]